MDELFFQQESEAAIPAARISSTIARDSASALIEILTWTRMFIFMMETVGGRRSNGGDVARKQRAGAAGA